MTTHHAPPHARQSVDVAIVGGGVAGASLAVVLARAGMEIAVVEREAQFRDRIRGESIHPWGVRELRRLGLEEILIAAGGRELPRWTRYQGGTASDSFAWNDLAPGSPGEMSVRHPELQHAMLAAASRAGAHVFQPAIAVPWRDGDSVGLAIEANGERIDLAVDLLVGADGQRSSLRTWIGAAARRDPVHHAIGGALFGGIDLPADSAHQAYFPGGFAMVFPQQGGSSRVYYVCSREAAAELQSGAGASDLPAAIAARLREVLPAGAVDRMKPLGPAGFFPNADIVPDRTFAMKTVLIGDAAGANDPSQGHGLSLVFRDVRGLQDLLRSTGDWTDIPSTFAASRRAYFEVLRQHARWSGPLMTDLGADADALRARVAAARKADPTAGGFAGIFVTGPDGLVANDAARRHFLGEDLSDPDPDAAS